MKRGRKRTEKFNSIHPTIQIANEGKLDEGSVQGLSKHKILETWLFQRITEIEDIINLKIRIREGKSIKGSKIER